MWTKELLPREGDCVCECGFSEQEHVVRNGCCPHRLGTWVPVGMPERHRIRLVVEVDNVVIDFFEFHSWLTELAIEVESDLKNGEIVAAAYWERAK